MGGLALLPLLAVDALTLDARSAPWVLLGCWTLSVLNAALPTAVPVRREPDPLFDDEPDPAPLVETRTW